MKITLNSEPLNSFKIIFDNNDDSERTVTDGDSLLIVEKVERSGRPVSPRELQPAVIFRGTANPVLYRRHYSAEFECQFDLQSYPFDTQVQTPALDGS